MGGAKREGKVSAASVAARVATADSRARRRQGKEPQPGVRARSSSESVTAQPPMRQARYGLLALLLLSACRAGSPDEPQRVPECEDYLRALAACHQLDAAALDRTGLLAKSDDDRERLKSVCALNLHRVTQACR
jgi:hypothetical protein